MAGNYLKFIKSEIELGNKVTGEWMG